MKYLSCFLWVLISACFFPIGCALEKPKAHDTDLQSFNQMKPQVATVEKTNGDLKASIDSARSHGQAALKAIANTLSLLHQSQPPQVVVPEVEIAGSEAVKADEDLKSAQTLNLKLGSQLSVLKDQITNNTDRIASLVSDNAQLTLNLSTVTKEKGDAIKGLKEATAKYNDAWLGGKAWRLIGWITGISIVLLIAGLILNLHTDIFVIPLRLIGRLLTPK